MINKIDQFYVRLSQFNMIFVTIEKNYLDSIYINETESIFYELDFI